MRPRRAADARRSDALSGSCQTADCVPSRFRYRLGMHVGWNRCVPVRRWSDLAWPELAGIQPGDVGLVPVGATEQHGPHLPTATDTIIATGICELASERTGAPV